MAQLRNGSMAQCRECGYECGNVMECGKSATPALPPTLKLRRVKKGEMFCDDETNTSRQLLVWRPTTAEGGWVDSF